MAALRYRDEHNKVGYLLKLTGSDDYHQIIDFLRASHISPKSGSWDQFGSPIAVAFICQSDGRRFNWSSYIFKGMVSNIGNAKKFLMYHRFLQAILGIETRIKRHYKVLMFSSKLFANMRLNFEGYPMPLSHVMLLQAQADPNTASFSRSHKTGVIPFPNVEDEPLEGSFHMSPPGSTQAPPAGQPSGGTEDPITLTALSSVVSTLVQKVNSLEIELKDHKKLFKDVVGNIPPGGASHIHATCTSVPAAVLTGASTVLVGSPSVPADVPPSVAPAGASSKGKSLIVEEEIPVKERKFKQMQEDILGEQAAKRLHDKEQAQLDRYRAELQRQRQQEVLDSAMYYTEADWINIMAHVEANASLSKILLGDDVSEDNFPARMAALIKRKK
nr:JmjC domain-containing protein [Tanacetum cinerariifolium]